MAAYLIVALGSGTGGALRHAVNVGAARFLAGVYAVGSVLLSLHSSWPWRWCGAWPSERRYGSPEPR